MAMINTVTGAIQSAELGRTLVHEHLMIRSDAVVSQFPHLYDNEGDYLKAVISVKSAKAKGIKTICDPTVLGLGRDAKFMERVANETEMQIVAATGIYSFNEIPFYFQHRNIDDMARVFVRDIEVGIQNTSIKAGFLKCAADSPGITSDLEKVFRAVARAHKWTGVPIMTHSHAATGNGLKQMDIFEEEGVDPKFVMIGHCGDSDNVEYVLEVLKRGAFIGMDRYGQPAYEQRNALLLELVSRGFADRMFLSQDYCCSIDWYPPDHEFYRDKPKWTMTFIVDEVIPDLLAAGVTNEQIETMLDRNARRWFEGL